MKKKRLETRFKILFHLVMRLGNLPKLEEQMVALSQKIDEDHPDCEKALTYFETEVLNILEHEEVS